MNPDMYAFPNGQQDPMQIRRRKVIGFTILAVAVIICVVVLVLLFRLSTAQQLRVVSTNPKLTSVATVTPFLKVTFNKELSGKNISITSSPSIVKSYSVSKKTLDINLNVPTTTGKTYTITIKNIADTSGDHLTNKNLTFTPQYVEGQSLPKDQQQDLLNQQDHYDSAATDPIIPYLPHETPTYNLTAQVTTSSNGQSKLVLNAQILLSFSDMSNEPAAIATYKQQVVSYIRSIGFDPTKYDIQYNVVAPPSD